MSSQVVVTQVVVTAMYHTIEISLKYYSFDAENLRRGCSENQVAIIQFVQSASFGSKQVLAALGGSCISILETETNCSLGASKTQWEELPMEGT